MVCHHLDAVKALATYDRSKALLSRNQEKMDWKALDDFDEVMRIAEAIEIVNVSLGQTEIVRIMDFLGALSDESAGKRGLGLTVSVPSGLAMDTLLSSATPCFRAPAYPATCPIVAHMASLCCQIASSNSGRIKAQISHGTIGCPILGRRRRKIPPDQALI